MVAKNLINNIKPPHPKDKKAMQSYLYNFVKLRADGGYFPGGKNVLTVNSSLSNYELFGYDLRNINFHIYSGASHITKLNKEISFNTDVLRQYKTDPLFFEELYENQAIFGWDFGNGKHITRSDQPNYDSEGRGIKIAYWDRMLLTSYDLQSLKNMIDAGHNNISSVGENTIIVEMIKHLVGLSVYKIAIMNETQSYERMILPLSGADFPKEIADNLKVVFQNMIKLLPYQNIGLGLGKDNSGYFMGVVLPHLKPEWAKANIERLSARLKNEFSFKYVGKKYADLFNLTHSKLWAEDKFLIGKIYSYSQSASNFWIEYIINRDPIFLHE